MMHAVIKGDRKLDIHQGNIMMRGSQLVIIDPAYNKDEQHDVEDLESILWDLKMNPSRVKTVTGRKTGGSR
jgi:hypothetical protein